MSQLFTSTPVEYLVSRYYGSKDSRVFGVFWGVIGEFEVPRSLPITYV